MPLIHWNDSYAVRHPEMDAQHQRLVELLNEFNVAWGEPAPPAKLLALFDQLVRHTLEHFRFEDELMQDAGYPATLQHRTEHESLLAQIRSKRDAIADGAALMSGELLLYMKQWFLIHLQDSDRELAEFLHRPTGQM